MSKSLFDVVSIDPVMLRPHPAIKSMPRWPKGSDGWHAFVQDIKSAGITHPLLVTDKNVVIDGETRRLAAVALQLPEVPCQIVDEAEVHTIILRELGLKRQLTKGQLAYLAVPHLEGAFKEATGRKKSGDGTIRTEFVCHTSVSSIEDFATFKGVSVRYLQIARQIHITLGQHTEFTEEAEAKVFDEEHPASLGAVMAWLGAAIAQRDREKAGQAHGGGRPQNAARQLDLFVDVFETETRRWEYWGAFDADTRDEAWRRLRTRFEALTPEERQARAAFHQRMARELKAVKDED